MCRQSRECTAGERGIIYDLLKGAVHGGSVKQWFLGNTTVVKRV